MKKLFYSIAAVAAIVFAASCNKEAETVATEGNTVTANFQIALPESDAATKAISDGLTAKNLLFYVYDEKGKYLPDLAITDQKFNNKTATISVQLIKGLKYSFGFIAVAEGNANSAYTFNPADSTFTVDYTKMTANDDQFDLFTASLNDYNVTGPFSETITLHRPMAQVNFGSSKGDFKAARASGIKVDEMETSFTFSEVGTAMNFLSGKVTATASDVLVGAKVRPADSLSVNGKKYNWVAMAYVLTGTDKALADVKLDASIKNADGPMTPVQRIVANVPIQRNHRTNILGNIFSVTADFTIVIDETFDTPDYVRALAWDGSIDETLDITADPIHIENGSQLARVAQLVNSGAETFAGKTLILDMDIDLNNLPWTPIGDKSNRFMGTFDGNGKTISNLKVNSDVQGSGLFGGVQTATISNLTIENANIVSTNKDAGVVAGSCGTSTTITGVTVNNASIKALGHAAAIAASGYAAVTDCVVDGLTIEMTPAFDGTTYDDADKAGAIVGYNGGESSPVITGNTVRNFTITAFRDAGAIAGYLNKYGSSKNTRSFTYKDNKAENGTINILNLNPYSGGKTPGLHTGEVTGFMHEDNLLGNSTIENNTFENVTLINNIAEGVMFKNGTYYVSPGNGVIATAISHAKANSVNPVNIVLKAGKYPEVANVTGALTFNITADEGLTADDVEIGGINHSTNGTPSTVNVKNISMNNSIQPTGWFVGTSQNINPCVGAWGGNFDFDGCTFKVSGNSKAETGIMTWWITSTVTFKFSNCLFTDCGDAYKPSSARAMQIYGDVNMTVDNCVFNTKKDYTLKYVAKAGNKASFSNCEVSNSENFVELGSAPYAGDGYAIEINNTTLGTGVNYYVVANEENQSVTIDGEVKK